MQIVKAPSEILRKGTIKISIDEIKSGSFNELILDMKKTMVENNGIGLAANQIGKDLSMFVISKELAEEHNIPEEYFNPEIAEYSRSSDEMEEGCLSIPEYFVPIQRSKKVKFKALNINGDKLKIKARGFLARVLQHETDHLNGIIIKDRFKK